MEPKHAQVQCLIISNWTEEVSMSIFNYKFSCMSLPACMVVIRPKIIMKIMMPSIFLFFIGGGLNFLGYIGIAA